MALGQCPCFYAPSPLPSKTALVAVVGRRASNACKLPLHARGIVLQSLGCKEFPLVTTYHPTYTFLISTLHSNANFYPKFSRTMCCNFEGLLACFSNFCLCFLILGASMNSWIKFQACIVTRIRNFNCTWLSYKRKYRTILNDYRNEKRMNKVSRSDRKHECRWFDEMNISNNTCASVYNQIRVSAMEKDKDDITRSFPISSKTILSLKLVPTIQEKKKEITRGD